MEIKEDIVYSHIKPIKVDESSVESIVDQISENLREPNKELISEIITALGVDRAMQYYNKTRIIEQQGGLYCKDGSRRRKPGGVFFHLIYHDTTVSECIKQIFSNEARKKYKLKKIEIKERRRKYNQELKERLIKEGLLIMSNGQLKNNE
ncbi:phosphorylated adapter RNA export protein [Halyomorpha halys]|uniref:phosphorylated adapter RNA export protein n=1 Tax=Halyomorpha halys TaxID=286706 RepID=UPI0006D4CB64|nr:phosphorylated adapter RNA export protein [Halyomorpha halys]XP_014285513.1 phosphorylated adapter RNA export protein [Halyomorpha halys]